MELSSEMVFSHYQVLWSRKFAVRKIMGREKYLDLEKVLEKVRNFIIEKSGNPVLKNMVVIGGSDLLSEVK